MSRSKHNPLLDELRLVIGRLGKAQGGSASEAADEVIATRPDLFAAYSHQYARNHFIALARREMKAMADQSLALSDSAPLFRGLQLDRIPAAICIPLEDGDTIYRPIRRATIGELREAVRARRKQIADNVMVADRMIELLDLRMSQGATDDDFVLPEQPPGKKAA